MQGIVLQDPVKMGYLAVKTMVAPKATMNQVKHVASRAWSTG